ncbi:MAG: hypothetical protein P1U63_05245 [Coxiellaceae bacterium]|nr:hypothetical protein [Coxiellaceae bacterium]
MSRASSVEASVRTIDSYITSDVSVNPGGSKKKDTTNVMAKTEFWEAIKQSADLDALNTNLSNAIKAFPSRWLKSDRYRQGLLDLQSAITDSSSPFESFQRAVASHITDAKAFPAGNEQFIAVPAEFKQATDFVLVGTSILQNVKLALELRATSDVKPSIVVVDNSRKVVSFWQKLKGATADASSASDLLGRVASIREACIAECLDGSKHSFDGDGPGSPTPGVIDAMRKMLGPGGENFEVIKQLIQDADVKLASWCDPTVMESIKKEAAGKPIVAYPSNIVAYLDDIAPAFGPGSALKTAVRGYDEASAAPIINLFSAVQTLDPVATLHTNMHYSDKAPSMALWFAGAGPVNAEQALSSVFSQRVYKHPCARPVSVVSMVDGEMNELEAVASASRPGWTSGSPATTAAGVAVGGGGRVAPADPRASEACGVGSPVMRP